MDNKTAGVVILLAIAAFALAFLFTNAFTGRASDVISLVTASEAVAGGSYDSVDSPVGTTYIAAGPLRFTSISLTADSATSTAVEFGYGTTHVEASTSTPASAVTLGAFTLPADSGLVTILLEVEVPGGRYPWVRVSGPATWPGRVTLLGVQR